MSNLTQPEPNEEKEPRQSVNDNALFSSNLSVTPGRPLLQYRNGFFQGYINEFDQRQGKGVYYWNSGEIYYGDWNLDRMEGEGIFYFALGGYVYGTFLDDKVHGYAILCFSNGDYIAGFWERGLLSGKAVQYSKSPNDWCLYEYKDGTSERTLMTGKGTPPIHTFSMLETYYLKKLIERDLSLFGEENINQEKPAPKNVDFLPIDPDGWYHGNLKNRGPHGLGIVCYSEHKSDRGIFKDGAVNGPGRSLFESGDVYDGYYKDGKFHGVGVYFKSETEQYLYGMYENNECIQALTLGNGYPHELMKTIKTDVKLDNIDFIDKETESEVLTLSSQDQSLVEAMEHKDKNLVENVHEGLFDKFLAQGENIKIIEAPSKLEKSEEEKTEELVPKKDQSDKHSNSAKNAETNRSKKSVEEVVSPQKEKNQAVPADNKAKTFNSAPKDHQKSQNELNERKIKTVEIKTTHSIEADKKTHRKSEGNPDSHRKGNPDISDNGSIDNYISRGNEATEEHVVKNTSKASQERSSQNKVNSKANLSNSQLVSEKSDPDFEARRYTFGVKKLGSFSDEQHSSEDKSAKNSQYQARTSEKIEKEPSIPIAENISRPYNKHENNIFTTHNPPADGRPYTEANSPEWRSLVNTPPRSIKSEADRNNFPNRNSGGDGKINRNEHHSINNEVQKIMEHIFGSGLPSNQDLEDLPQASQRLNDVNGSFGSPQKHIGYIESMSFRKSGDENNGNKPKSVPKSETDSHSELQAKTPVNNKEIEHSQVSNNDNSTPRRDEEKSSDNIRRGSNVESGRMVTDTWSLHTGGSQAGGYHGAKTPVLGRGNDGLSSEYNLVREVTSEILDSQRYKPKRESHKSKPNEYVDEEKEHNQPVFDDDIFKVMLVKMELLMREQSKTVETMGEMKRSFGASGFDSTKDILQRMYNELVELNKLSHISLSVVHTKLDSLLLQQGCKPTDIQSIRGNTQTLLAQESMKRAILSSPQRPEIYIVDSQMENQKRTLGEKRLYENDSPDLPSGQLFKSQYNANHEPRSSASTYEQPNSANYLFSATKRNSPYKNKDFEYNDDLANYMSVAPADSVAKKQINSMTPNSRQFAIRNESTFSQYDERLQNNNQDHSGQSHLTNSVDKNKSSVQQSVDYIPSTPGKKPGEIAFTTPQSKNANYQEDYAKRLQTRSPIQSNRSSVIMDANGSPVKAEIYASKHSHTSSNSRNNQTLEARTFSNSPDKFNSRYRNELEEKKNLDHSSVGKYGTHASKGNENISASNHNSVQHNLPEERGIRERFTVTSNNNKIPNNDEYIHIDNGNSYNRNVGVLKSENTLNSAKKFSEYYGGNSYNLADSGVSPNRYRREPVTSPYKQRNTVHEGRLGTVRWRLELEQVEDEYDRIPQRDNMAGEFRVVGVPEQYNSQSNHENSLKSYNQMKNSRSGRPSSMIGVPSQEQRWNEEGPVKQETSQVPFEYNHSSNRQVYKLSEKAKQNFVVDSHMASLAKTSEVVARPHQEQSFPKRENYNPTSSSYVREDEVLDERYKNYDTPKKNWDSGMVESYYKNGGLGQR